MTEPLPAELASIEVLASVLDPSMATVPNLATCPHGDRQHLREQVAERLPDLSAKPSDRGVALLGRT